MVFEFPSQVESFMCHDLEIKDDTERNWQLVTSKFHILNLILADHEQIVEDAIKMEVPTIMLNLFQKFI